MNEQNEKIEKTGKDSVLYKRAKIAKSAVRSVLEHGDPFNNAEDLLNYIHTRFTPDERVVIASGSFTPIPNGDGGLQFLMPTTSRVIRYFNNGTERFKKGYTKVVVTNQIEDDGRFRHFTSDKYELFSDELIAERNAKPVDEKFDETSDYAE